MISNHFDNYKIMMFVDGENLSIQYGKMSRDNKPHPSVTFETDVFVWSKLLNLSGSGFRNCEVMRRYYYTSVVGTEDKRHDIHKKLESLGIEVPKVFRKEKGRPRAKEVDIALSVDMLVMRIRKTTTLLY